LGRSRHSHGAVTPQSRDGHATVTGRSRHSHGTVTPQSRDGHGKLVTITLVSRHAYFTSRLFHVTLMSRHVTLVSRHVTLVSRLHDSNVIFTVNKQTELNNLLLKIDTREIIRFFFDNKQKSDFIYGPFCFKSLKLNH
jgi:hypothetical protein